MYHVNFKKTTVMQTEVNNIADLASVLDNLERDPACEVVDVIVTEERALTREEIEKATKDRTNRSRPGNGRTRSTS